MLDGDKVRLTVEVDETELAPEIDAAFRRIGRNMRIPGFRQGRAPRRVLEARLGSESARAEAFRTCLPEYCRRAVIAHELDSIDHPEIDILEGSQSGPLHFVATVPVRPTITVSGYEALRIEIPNPIADTEEINAEIDELRRQFAQFATVDRPAIDGDHLRIDITCTSSEGRTVDGLNASDYDYELGAGAVVPEIDENLRGSVAGDVLEFTAAHTDRGSVASLSFKVLVKEVRKTILPKLDDEFTAANSECDTVEELVEVIRREKSSARRQEAVSARRLATEAAVSALVHEVPEAMVRVVLDRDVIALQNQCKQRGHTIEDLLAASGQSAEELYSQLKARAIQAVKLDLALRAVAASEGLEADDAAVDEAISARLADGDTADLPAPEGAPYGKNAADRYPSDAELDRQKRPTGGEPPRTASRDDIDAAVVNHRRALQETGLIMEMKASLSKLAAFDWISKHVQLVDPAGAVIDPELLEPRSDSSSAAGLRELDASGAEDAASA